jgi:hypothetical protein
MHDPPTERVGFDGRDGQALATKQPRAVRESLS